VTTVQQEAPVAITGTLSESSSLLDDCTGSASAEVLSYNAMLDNLDANDLDALASLIHDRAARQREQISYDDALALIEAAWLGPAADRSQHKEIIRVAVALRRCIERGKYHPEQVRDTFLLVAYERAPHPRIALTAISEGIRKGLAGKAAANGN
jgi:hypothetical protein